MQTVIYQQHLPVASVIKENLDKQVLENPSRITGKTIALINTFHAIVLFLYALKTSKNLSVFLIFSGGKERDQ